MPTNTKPNNSGYRWRNPCAEEATRADIEGAFGTAAYWRYEVKRITNREAREKDAKQKRYLRLMLLNAQTQLGLCE